tara:strand:+ start:119 stop:298 length:180 start_codon:yes stop_codon:yes gene_type:complete
MTIGDLVLIISGPLKGNTGIVFHPDFCSGFSQFSIGVFVLGECCAFSPNEIIAVEGEFT